MLSRMLRRGNAGPNVESPARVPFWGDAAIADVAIHAEKGSWQVVEDFLRQAQPLETRDACLAAIVHGTTGRPAWLDAWVAARPGDYLPLTARGAHSVHWAWEARGHDRASTTSHEQFARFFDRLRLAQEDLQAAAAMAPTGDPGPWLWQVTMGRGLQLAKEEQWGIFHELRARSEWHPIGFSSMIQSLAPKWDGSIEEMMVLARSTASAPEGSSVHVALLEGLREAAFEAHSPEWWLQAGLREEIVGAAVRSIESPRYVPSPRSLRDHNWFLFAFGQVGEVERFRRELAVVQGRLTSPFSLWPDPTAPYRTLRWNIESVWAKGGPRS